MKRISEKNINLFDNKLKKIKSSSNKLSKAVKYLENLSNQNCMQMFYFGGFLRDLWLNKKPRDIDLVYHSSDKALFEYLTSSHEIKKTRFGGSKLNYKGIEIDAWPIEATSAYKSQDFSLGIHRLPETTFFNVESIVLEIFSPTNKWGWENGFFKGCETKTLDIQELESVYKNTFPELQLIRTIELKNKLKWKVGNKLKEYIKTGLERNEGDYLSFLYYDHYGKVLSKAQIKRNLLSIINEE